MYGIAVLGARGGEHSIKLLRPQLEQIMQQLGCEEVLEF